MTVLFVTAVVYLLHANRQDAAQVNWNSETLTDIEFTNLVAH